MFRDRTGIQKCWPICYKQFWAVRKGRNA